MSVQRRYTSADLEMMPYVEGLRYEIIDGELQVSRPWSWWHQRAASQISIALSTWSDQTCLGESVMAPGVIFGPYDEAIPDTMWISQARFAGALNENGHLIVAPELMLEVLMPDADDHRRVYDLKLQQYGRFGVTEYWIVDWQRQTAQMFRRNGPVLERAATLSGDDAVTSPLLPGFACPLRRLW